MDKRAASEKGITTMEWTTETGGYILECNEGGWVSIPNGKLWDNRWITREAAASTLAEAIEHWLKADMYRTWEWTW